MSIHSVTRSNVALNTANDVMTIIAAANRKIRILEVTVGGMGTASAANEVAVQRSTGGTTGGGAITPESFDPDSLADSVTVVNTTWAAQPTLSGSPELRLPVNANGGVFRWVARPGQELNVRNSGQLSIRPAVGSSNISIHVVYELM
jgi:hypothetical protein